MRRFLFSGFCRGWVLAFIAPVSGWAAKTTWWRVQTEDIILVSDAAPKDIVEYVVDYSAFRQVFKTLIAPDGRQPPPAVVMLFRNTGKFEEHFPRQDSTSRLVCLRTEVDDQMILAQALAGNRSEALRLAFEFETTWALRRVGYALPIWMAQGTGKVFSTLRLKSNTCVVGEPLEHQAVDWLQENDEIRWQRFFDIYEGSPEYNARKEEDPEKMLTYHLQTWALMHRIWFGTDRGREKFEALARQLRTTPAIEAVPAVLGIEPKDLSKEMSRHLRKWVDPRQIPFDTARLRARLQMVPASEADVGLPLSSLLLSVEKFAEADREVDRAQASAPDLPEVKEALARRALRRDNRDAAVALYREAIAKGSVNPEAYLTSARGWLDQTNGGSEMDRAGSGSDLTDQAIAEVRRALELNPGSVRAYNLLGRAFFIRPVVTKEHLAELSRGIGPNDAGRRAQHYRALLHERLGQLAECRADLQSIVQDRESASDIRRLAQQRWHNLAYHDVQQQVEVLAKEKRYDEAREAIAKARDSETGQFAGRSLDKLQAWLTERERRETAIPAAKEKFKDLSTAVRELVKARKFAEARERVAAARTPESAKACDQLLHRIDENEAVHRLYRLAREKKWEEAIQGGDTFIAQYPRSPLIASVRQMQAAWGNASLAERTRATSP